MKHKILKISTFILVLDQFVKYIIINNFSYGNTLFIIPKFLYITYVKNTGGAWSIFNENPQFLLIVGLISIIIFSYYIFKKNIFNLLEIIYLGLIIGGVLGNFIDRLFKGGVVDYIGLIFGNYYYPIFNIADICIVCGMCLLLIDSFRSDKNGIRSSKR